MTPNTHELLEQALKLPREARAAIAESLLESLTQHVDEDTAEPWDEAPAERIRELESGELTLVHWSEVRRIIAGT